MAKREGLVRFGVAMEAPLLRAIDAIVRRRSSTRSELLRDLARAEVTREEVASGIDAVATVTLVYDHHVRDLTERLIELQHGLGGKIRSSMHVHLDAAHCLEVIILQGPADELRRFADRVFATRGVKHGGIEVIAATKSTSSSPLHVHLHAHDHAEPAHRHADHDHAEHSHTEPEHNHDHVHDHAPPPSKKKRRP